VPRIRQAKAALRHAFELQADGVLGLSLVEILSPCPTYWRMSPSEAMTWIEEHMSKAFPIGRLKG
jgi:pyruvate/2-oxoacid:ferredoxin oxidoreductase beta subunit